MHTPHDRPLIRGDGDALLHHFEACFPQAREVWITVAFVMDAGVDLIHPFLEDLLEREGTRLRLLTGDYFEVSEPRGLERLLDLALHYNREDEPDRVELRVFETRGGSKRGGRGPGGSLAFHPKAYLFLAEDKAQSVAFVGSSNLSRSALTWI